jgi:hypothetical protein
MQPNTQLVESLCVLQLDDMNYDSRQRPRQFQELIAR